jgi:hypothetical protein
MSRIGLRRGVGLSVRGAPILSWRGGTDVMVVIGHESIVRVPADLPRRSSSGAASPSNVAGAAAGEPVFQVVPLLPGFSFRGRLVSGIIPMLSTCVGLVARIEAFLR